MPRHGDQLNKLYNNENEHTSCLNISIVF